MQKITGCQQAAPTRASVMFSAMTITFVTCLILLTGLLLMVSGIFAYHMIDDPKRFGGITLVASLSAMGIIYWQVKSRSACTLIKHLVSDWKQSMHLPDTPLHHSHSLPDLYRELKTLTTKAIENHRMHLQLKMKLESQRKKLALYESQSPIKAEFKGVFSRVQHYANMLDESIEHKKTDPALRDEFDELAEYCVNLQLLTRGMEVLQTPVPKTPRGLVNPANVMSNLLLSLSASLERRNMSLSTLAWDEKSHAFIDSNLLELLTWLILLGAIRYAEDQSTLSLGCESDSEHDQTRLTCLITELAPASMQAQERLAFMEAKGKYENAHMFAQTLANNTNYVLAEQLAARANATLKVEPVSQNSCLVELILPA